MRPPVCSRERRKLTARPGRSKRANPRSDARRGAVQRVTSLSVSDACSIAPTMSLSESAGNAHVISSGDIPVRARDKAQPTLAAGTRCSFADRDDVALGLAADRHRRDRIGDHHQLSTVHPDEHDVGLDVFGKVAERSVGDGFRSHRNGGQRCDVVLADPVCVEESLHVLVLRYVRQTGEPVGHAAHRAVAVILGHRREDALGRLHPEDTAGGDPPATSVRSRFRHRFVERRHRGRFRRRERDRGSAATADGAPRLDGARSRTSGNSPW